MLLDCVYILEHHPNLFLANFWALNCVGNFTGSNLFEPEVPELDLNLWSGPRFRHLPEPNHRSSSRFTEILKEPDRTGLRQHYRRRENHLGRDIFCTTRKFSIVLRTFYYHNGWFLKPVGPVLRP